MKKSLGKNIDKLFQEDGESIRVLKKSDGQEIVRNIALSRIKPSENQPRKTFLDHSIEELAASIRESGIIQPLIVRPSALEGFELIAGERRYRAAQIAGLQEVPVIVRDWDDTRSGVAALVENIQREDLDPVEKAKAFLELVERHKWKQSDLAAKLGLSRSQVANTLRLLKLDPWVLECLQLRYLTEGHAKVLAGLTLDNQRKFCNFAVQKDWSVRQLEAAIEKSKQQQSLESPVVSATEREREFFYGKIKEKISEKILAPVDIKEKEPGRGQLIFYYQSDEDLINLLNRLSLEDIFSSL